MLFLTEVLGAEVVDVRQRRSGRVKDLAVRIQEPYPVVTGLVVSRRRELLIPQVLWSFPPDAPLCSWLIGPERALNRDGGKERRGGKDGWRFRKRFWRRSYG